MNIDYDQEQPPPSPCDFFIESSGDLAAANQLSADLVAAIRNLARFASIRDPTKYIIIPMLRPHLVMRMLLCKIYEFAGKFYFYDVYLETCFKTSMDVIKGDTISNYNRSVVARRLRPDRIWGLRDNRWVHAHTSRPLALLHMR